MAKVTDEGVCYPEYLFKGMPGAPTLGPKNYEDIFGKNPFATQTEDPSDILFSEGPACGVKSIGHGLGNLKDAKEAPDEDDGIRHHGIKSGTSGGSSTYDPLALGNAAMKDGAAHKKTDDSFDPMSIIKGASSDIGKVIGKNPLGWSSSDGLAGDSGSATIDAETDPSSP
jgi:hypothetical protein